MLTRLTVLLAVFAVACGDDRAPAVPNIDGGPDSGPTDAGWDAGMDAGPEEMDAGMDAATDAAADAGDAATDAGPPDAGPCVTNEDCDDGLLCNGSERCVEGTCLAGTSLECDDGIACTVDRCNEPSGDETDPFCSSTRDDSLCETGETCITSTSSGCAVPCTGGESGCKLTTPQCGCRLDEGCYLSGSSPVCRDVGTLPIGSLCSAIDDCIPGLGCRTISGSAKLCSRFCEDDADCTGDALCVVEATTSGDATFCSRECDPVAQTGCVGGAACTVSQEAGGSARYYTDCRAAPSSGGGQGATCEEEVDCGAGFTCLGGTSCAQYCESGGSTTCPGTTTCSTTTFSATIGGTTWGACE